MKLSIPTNSVLCTEAMRRLVCISQYHPSHPRKIFINADFSISSMSITSESDREIFNPNEKLKFCCGRESLRTRGVAAKMDDEEEECKQLWQKP